MRRFRLSRVTQPRRWCGCVSPVQQPRELVLERLPREGLRECYRCGDGVVPCLSLLRSLIIYPLVTHGLRRGLHSFAASRLWVLALTSDAAFPHISRYATSAVVRKRRIGSQGQDPQPRSGESM